MGDDSIESIKSEIVAAIAEGRSARDTIASNVESAKQGIERTTISSIRPKIILFGFLVFQRLLVVRLDFYGIPLPTRLHFSIR